LSGRFNARSVIHPLTDRATNAVTDAVPDSMAELSDRFNATSVRQSSTDRATSAVGDRCKCSRRLGGTFKV
jgi:hypothetical protein